MKTKSLNLVFAGILLTLFLVGFTSALTLSGDSTLSKYENSGYKIITVKTDYNETDSINLTIQNSYNGISFKINGSDSFTVNTDNETSETINVSYEIENGFNFNFPNDHIVTLKATSDNSDDASMELKFKNTFCEYEDFGYLDLEISDWRVVSGYGDDDKWFPLDEIEIEITIENNDDYDLRDVKIEWGLYDEENKEWAIEVDDEDEFDLDEGEDEVITFTFTLDGDLDLKDFEDLLDSDSLTLYVRATGQVDDSDSSHDGEKTCVSSDETFNVIIENDFVVLSDLEMPESVQCSSQLQISGDVWNIGDNKQGEVELKIVISALDIEEYVKIGDLDNDFDKQSFNINLEIPEDAKAGIYPIKFFVLDEDGDTYEADNDDELSSFSKTITVTGDCSTTKVGVSAVLQSGGMAGEELVVKATLINPGTKESQYLLNVAGYADWVDSAELSQNSVTLKAGESAEVLVTLDVKKDTEGEKVFNLEIASDGKLIAAQPVSVGIEKSSLFGGITGFAINQDNWQIWGIGFLNLILVIIIIVVAVRIARRK